MGVYILWWILSLSLWLYFAYTLEFGGINCFLHVWVSSLLFQVATVLIVLRIIAQLKSKDGSGDVVKRPNNVVDCKVSEEEKKKFL